MNCPIERGKHTPEEHLYLTAEKKLVALLNLDLNLGHITKEEFESQLRDKMAKYSQYTEAQRHIEYLLQEETGSDNAFDFEQQIKAEGYILTHVGRNAAGA